MPTTRNRRATTIVAAAVALSVAATAVGAAAVEAAAKTKRASVRNNGNQSNGEVSFGLAISGNGRFLVFRSDASNLVGNDGNLVPDLFVRDFAKRKTRRVSLGSGGTEANGSSTQGSISGDGRFVAFRSSATNIGGGASGLTTDIFLRDRKKNKTRRLTRSNKGVPSSSDSFEPEISANGRFVTYYTLATDIVPNDDNGGWADVLVYDRVKRQTSRVSKSTKGVQGDLSSFQPDISGDGRFVVFASKAKNLVDTDVGGFDDIFLHDRRNKTTRLISRHTNKTQANGNSFEPAISANGRWIAYTSHATNLVDAVDDNGVADVFLYDRKTRKTRRVSQNGKGVVGNRGGGRPTLSNDGRFVAFDSSSENFAGKDTNNTGDVYVYDRKTKRPRLVSLKTNGNLIPWGARQGVISGDGRFVGFTTGFGLGKKDTNDKDDAFRRGPLR